MNLRFDNTGRFISKQNSTSKKNLFLSSDQYHVMTLSNQINLIKEFRESTLRVKSYSLVDSQNHEYLLANFDHTQSINLKDLILGNRLITKHSVKLKKGEYQKIRFTLAPFDPNNASSIGDLNTESQENFVEFDIELGRTLVKSTSAYLMITYNKRDSRKSDLINLWYSSIFKRKSGFAVARS